MEIPRERAEQARPETIMGVIKAIFPLGAFVERAGLERSLRELVNTRASQINGCAYCLDMHFKDARAHGESDQRLYLLNAWREASHLYSERERAALAWTEAVTLVADSHVPDAVYEEVRRSFTDDEIVVLTAQVIAINAFNRANVALRTVPGSYEPGMAPPPELVGAAA